MNIDFEKLMSSKSDDELQHYLDNSLKFTAETLEAVIKEFQKRGKSISNDDLIRTKQIIDLKQVRDNHTQISDNKGRAHYLWGILGFIPIVGVFVGVILIILGVFRYGNKWLVIIGSSCILLTVIFYVNLLDNLKTVTKDKSNFAPISQIGINDLVKEIEFYKVTHGVYPNHLDDIQESEEIISIIDPILLSNSTEGDLNYRYQKIGDKYKLYSVGIDMIENTSDDLYPTISISDSTKIGFIRKN
jgi:hypothetical protein